MRLVALRGPSRDVAVDEPFGPSALNHPVAERVVVFYNQRATAKQWIKEGKTALADARSGRF
jgi:hypothetical protein